jgi:TolB protein
MERPGIYTMHADGSGVRTILSYGWDPAVSPEGDRIAFAVTRRGGTDLYLMKANGTHVRRLTHGRGLHSNSEPAWSPDGRQIAFRHVHGRGIGRADIWIVTLATRTLTRFTNAKAYDAAPDWSPDGTAIAFASERAWAPDSEGNWDVWIKDVATGDVTRLTRNLAYESDPSWSPDGSAIAFESDRGGDRQSRIWVEDLGGRVRRVTRAGRTGDREPDWSPNASRIAFIRGRTIRVLELGNGLTVIARGTAERAYASPAWRAV